VPTGGGLVAAQGATQGAAVAVAIGAFDRLAVSPLLSAATIGAPWSPAELPGAASTSRGAVAVGVGQAAVVLAAAQGTLVAGDADRWTQLTTAATLDPKRRIRLDAITWANGSLGWLTAHGSSGVAMAFQTTDGGHSWHGFDLASGSSVAALAPCGAGEQWLLPLISVNGYIQVERTADGGRTWSAGQLLALAAGLPTWACHGHQVLLAGRAGKADHVFASVDDGASWHDRGAAPAGLSDLAITGDGTGFATSMTSHGPMLWSVSASGARFSPLALPTWVKTIGAQTGQS
jgi:hypothetical protein